jgi:parallel beta-helix repeat protein
MMQAFRKTASVLIVSTIVCLGAACERAGMPTEPTSATGVTPVFNDDEGSGTTIWVNHEDPNGGLYAPPGTSCNDPGYPTIQAAVNAAAPGDRINVCSGTYQEQVTIPAGKDNIRLRSVQRWQAVIAAPALMIAGPGATFSIVRVTSAQNVTILGFTISGPGPAGCGSLHFGVRVDNAGSANVLGNHITHIRDNPLGGCQNGVGVQVGRFAEATTGSAQIIGNVIDDYQKNGLTVSNTGSNADIISNRIFGIGPTMLIAQNGIQVSSGATANVRHNFVAKNVYSPGTFVSTGILLFQSGKVVTEHNTATTNDVGIYLFEAGSGSSTTYNRVRASTFDGVAVDCSLSCSVGSQVASNDIDHNGGPGIGMYDGMKNNRLDNNEVEDNADSGILLDNASNNVVSSNNVRENGTDNGDMTDGIRINAPSTGNTISDNRLKENVTHDCHEGSTGNIWTDNRGETSFPAGLCSGKDDGVDDESVETSTAHGWDASYPWYAGNADAANFDWIAAYSSFDTQTLLQLVPAIRTGAIHGAAVSPNQ